LKHLPHIFPLGDGAATIDLGNVINDSLNGKVLAMAQWLAQNSFDGLLDIITAYASLTLVYDPVLVKNRQQPAASVFEWVRDLLIIAWKQSGHEVVGEPLRHRIPVCYEAEFGPDLAALAAVKGLSAAELVQLHAAGIYKVYMIGFLPGFSYMGGLDERIAANRKENPVLVQAGSVGIAGSQTGIYPFTSPGGWHIIGRTPLKMFNPAAENPVLFKAGDEVTFYAINSHQWHHSTW
jgi:inhibitor of KinA